jgi:hypothetical protein
VEDGEDYFFFDGDVNDSAEFAADGGDDGVVVEEEGRDHIAAGGVLAVTEFDVGFLGVAFLREEVKFFERVVAFVVEVEKVDFDEESLVDGFCKDDLVETPSDGVGENDPFHALVGGVVDGLFDVAVVEFDADGFDFNDLD